MTSGASGNSSCWSTGSATRVANVSPGSSRTGSRLIVASAAPVTMFVAPGPIDVVQASVESRFRIRANADDGVDHRLLVAGLAIRQEPGVASSASSSACPTPGDVAVAEDPEAALDQALAHAVALGVLGGEEPDDRLADGQPDGPATHDDEAAAPSARRTAAAGRPPGPATRRLTQAWAGSSQAEPRPLAGAGHHVQVVEVVARRAPSPARASRAGSGRRRRMRTSTRTSIGRSGVPYTRWYARPAPPDGPARPRRSRSPRARSRPGRASSCLCGGYEPQLPLGVRTSTAISRSASNALAAAEVADLARHAAGAAQLDLARRRPRRGGTGARGPPGPRAPRTARRPRSRR